MVQFIDLWRGHPINESVTAPCVAPHDLTNMEGQHVAMGFPVFHNQCAIRLGIALRRAGVTDGQIGGCAACAVHPRSEMHFINASQLANALAHANIPGIGTVEKITGTEAATTIQSCSGAPASSISRTTGSARPTAAAPPATTSMCGTAIARRPSGCSSGSRGWGITRTTPTPAKSGSGK